MAYDILIVEDEPVMREALLRIVEEMNIPEAHCRGMATLDEAIKVSTSVTKLPRFVLIDPGLPAGNGVNATESGLSMLDSGLKTIRAFREKTGGNAPFAICTSRTIDEGSDVVRFFHTCLYEHKAMGIIFKTLDLQPLASAIHECLNGRPFVPIRLREAFRALKLSDTELESSIESSNEANEEQDLPCNLTPRQMDVLKYLCEGDMHEEIAFKLNLSTGNIRGIAAEINKKFGTQHRGKTQYLVYSNPKFLKIVENWVPHPKV